MTRVRGRAWRPRSLLGWPRTSGRAWCTSSSNCRARRPASSSVTAARCAPPNRKSPHDRASAGDPVKEVPSMKTEVRQFIVDTLEQMSYDVAGVDDDTTLGPTGLDLESLAVAELAVRVEDQYGVKF